MPLVPKRPPSEDRPARDRRSSRRPEQSGGWDPRGGHSHLVLATMGVGLYLSMLWFGIAVIGDNPVRSSVMAALIVAIAATGYVFTRSPVPSDD